MNLSVGIVGLPNVGKSTLFNALLKKQVANVANYPFCTIEPNIGVVEVPDERLGVLAQIVHTNKIIPAIVDFFDIAGLVKGASEGEGLGNKFLSHIREAAVIAHVVRLFQDDNIVHVSNVISPKDDVSTIDSELILADLATLDEQREPRMNATKEEIYSFSVIKKVREKLNQGISVRKQNLDESELRSISQLHLLTIKPVLYVFNVSESQIECMEEINKQVVGILSSIEDKSPFIILCAKLETEVLALQEEEQKEYLKQFHLDETGLNRLIKRSYSMLHLISFLTAGEKEVRAWTITKGTRAPQAAGVIHTDFEKHFIKADVIQYKDFVELNGWGKAREQGKVAIVGKDYEMKDGDVVEFKVGV